MKKGHKLKSQSSLRKYSLYVLMPIIGLLSFFALFFILFYVDQIVHGVQLKDLLFSTPTNYDNIYTPPNYSIIEKAKRISTDEGPFLVTKFQADDQSTITIEENYTSIFNKPLLPCTGEVIKVKSVLVCYVKDGGNRIHTTQFTEWNNHGIHYELSTWGKVLPKKDIIKIIKSL